MNFGASDVLIRAPEEVIAPLDRVNASVRRGDSVRIEVVVRTRKVGHFFPGGTVSAFDVWAELDYRQLHPDDNNERQSIHEHRSAGADGPSK